MIIKLKDSIAGYNSESKLPYSYAKGAIVNAPDHIGKDLIKSGLAEKVTAKKASINRQKATSKNKKEKR